MSDTSDFFLADEEPTASPAGVPPVPAPVIVVQYQRRSLFARLVPPLLILLAAVAIAGYERRHPSSLMAYIRGEAVPTEIVSKAKAPEPAPSPNSPAVTSEGTEQPGAEKLANEPIAAIESPGPNAESPKPKGLTGQEPKPEPAATPDALAARSPFEIDPSDGLIPLEFGPAVETVPETPELSVAGLTVPVPVPQPGLVREPKKPPQVPAGTIEEVPLPNPPQPPAQADVTKEAVLEDIKREAKQKAAEEKELAGLKPRAQAMLRAEVFAKVQASRSKFLGELRGIVKEFGQGAGPEIEKLCQQYGRQALPEAQSMYYRGVRLLSPRITRKDEIEFMRTCGLPEPVILDYLSHKLHQTMKTRGGPKDSNEVKVRAARLLLNYPPPNTNAKAGAQGIAVAAPVGTR